ncbi:MAG: SxtJ family membrane protein [Vicinamibacterales bacterium]
MKAVPVEREEVVGPSNRSFGLVFAVVLALVGFIPVWRGGSIRLWVVIVAVAFGTAALVAPALLTPLNRIWLRLGLAMHRIVNPVVMAVLFYLAVTPVGLLRQALRKGLSTRLRPDPAARTYWIDRAKEPFSPMNRQF